MDAKEARNGATKKGGRRSGGETEANGGGKTGSRETRERMSREGEFLKVVREEKEGRREEESCDGERAGIAEATERGGG